VGSLGPDARLKFLSATSNHLAGFTVVRADSHAAAARLFDMHPHFSMFPGDSVEVMPVMAIPGG
jgi:hypothetical protein